MAGAIPPAVAPTILSDALLRVLVCPVCHHAVVPGPDQARHDWLVCTACGRYYPVLDGIAVMLEQRATREPPTHP